MNRSLLLTGALLLIADLCHAQTLIPKAGVTISTMAVEDDQGIKSKIGYTFGIGYNIPVNDLFSIQPELNYVQKGLKRDFDEEGPYYELSQKSSLTVNYLELPVLVKMTFGTETKFYLNAGPSIAMGLGGRDKSKIDYTLEPQGDDPLVGTGHIETTGKVKFGKMPDGYEGEDRYFENRFDIGAQFGGGAIINDKIMIDLRYGLGFSNLYGNDDDDRSKHRVLQFTIGAPISIK